MTYTTTFSCTQELRGISVIGFVHVAGGDNLAFEPIRFALVWYRGGVATNRKRFWQECKAYYGRVWRRALSDTWGVLGLNKATVSFVLTTIVAWLILWRFFDWSWSTLIGEIIPAIALVAATVIVGLLALLLKVMVAPVLIDREQQRTIKLAKRFDIVISQEMGFGDKLQSAREGSGSPFLTIHHLVVVNHSERDEVVSIKLWWPLDNTETFLSPQIDDLPPGISNVSLLNRTENIPSRKSAMGSLFFRIPKNAPTRNNAPFHIITVKSHLTGVERAFNTLNFAEVIKPYPRTLEELNQQLSRPKSF